MACDELKQCKTLLEVKLYLQDIIKANNLEKFKKLFPIYLEEACFAISGDIPEIEEPLNEFVLIATMNGSTDILKFLLTYKYEQCELGKDLHITIGENQYNNLINLKDMQIIKLLVKYKISCPQESFIYALEINASTEILCSLIKTYNRNEQNGFHLIAFNYNRMDVTDYVIKNYKQFFESSDGEWDHSIITEECAYRYNYKMYYYVLQKTIEYGLEDDNDEEYIQDIKTLADINAKLIPYKGKVPGKKKKGSTQREEFVQCENCKKITSKNSYEVYEIDCRECLNDD